MKVKVIILTAYLFLTAGSSMCQNWNNISKSIKEEQVRIAGESTYILCHYNLRKRSKCFSQLNVQKNDTIFLLEDENDYSSPTITLTLWNRSDTLTYDSDDCYYNSNNGGENYTQSNKIDFTKYMMKLVSEWNLEEIKKEDITNGGTIPQYMVFATRIIIDDKKYKVDCIYFREFFNLQRDNMDFK